MSATTATMPAVASIPVFTLATDEVVQDGLDLFPYESGLQGGYAVHLGRVLRGHRGGGAGPVHAGGRPGLEVGLSARSTARVGAGDGQCRWRCQVRHRATIGGHRGIVVR